MRRSGRIFKQALGLLLLWGILEAGAGVLPAEAPAVAISHNASIVWPISDMVFRGGSFIKIKVEATTGLGTGDVRFFASTNLIGSVAQAPFNLIWQLPGGADGDLQLTAVALDQQGGAQTSRPVHIYRVGGRPTLPVVEISSPLQGEMFAAPAEFEIRAELLSSMGEAGPVEFFLDGGSLGVVDRSGWFTEATSYYAMSATNLAEGDHKLSVQYRGANGIYCECGSVTVRVVKLGIHAPRIAAGGTPLDGRVEFEVVTSFPGKPTIIQVSTNFLDRSAISTNVPPGNTFTFAEASPASLLKRWYRAIVPP